jgi:hypothetical protein
MTQRPRPAYAVEHSGRAIFSVACLGAQSGHPHARFQRLVGRPLSDLKPPFDFKRQPRK